MEPHGRTRGTRQHGGGRLTVKIRAGWLPPTLPLTVGLPHGTRPNRFAPYVRNEKPPPLAGQRFNSLGRSPACEPGKTAPGDHTPDDSQFFQAGKFLLHSNARA